VVKRVTPQEPSMPSSGRGWMIINVHPNLDGKYQHALTSLVVDLPQWWLMVVNGG